MTLPDNIRVNVVAPFPARVAGSAYIAVTKANGIWTIAPDYTLLSLLPSLTDPTAKELVVFDAATGIFNTILASTLISSLMGSYRMVTAAGDVTVGIADVGILLNKTVGAATNVNLPTSASRNGVPIFVKDYKGDANTNNITFVMSGTETIDGLTQAAANAAGVSKIDINFDRKTLYPLTGGGWYT